jgi:NADPH:quinone reductase-like Zn-dependent oxidoreductase
VADDELLIRVRAAAVANWDDIVRQGNWDVGGKLPLALGVQVAGEVVSAGAAADGFAEGDAVMAHPLPLRDQGAWAEQMLIAAEAAAHKPESVGWEEAAAFPVPALTAHQVLTEALEVDAVANAVRNGEPDAVTLLRRGGRFATITGAPPDLPRDAGHVVNCYVRADGRQLRELARMLARRELSICVAAIRSLTDAPSALDAAVAGRYAGAVVLQPRPE